jgi:hypothetical protein
MGGDGSGKPKGELLKLDGTTIINGKIEKTKFFDFLQTNLSDYSDVEMTPEQALKFKNTIVRMKHGVSAAMPMQCGGKRCFNRLCVFHETQNWPLGKQCHPPGALVKIANGRNQYVDIPVEKLNDKKHKIISFYRKKQQIRTNYKSGYDFVLDKKVFCGNLVQVFADYTMHEVTPDHISIAKFNEKAFGKFCVYLMKRNNHWRIGKSTVCKRGGKDKKPYLGFVQRALKEDADSVWILGVYDTNTEALLAEEWFSITWQISKVSFVDSLLKTDSKYNGLYKWATEEQMQNHHDSLMQPENHYREKLQSIGKSIDFPIWEKTNYKNKTSKDVKLYSRFPMFIRACNLVSDIMDVPVFPEFQKCSLHMVKTDWQTVGIKYRRYTGFVYSLDVKNKYKTYFANNIATHNCPMEAIMIQSLTKDYMEDLDVDPGSISEMTLINKLVECDMIDFRANLGLSGSNSRDEDAATLLSTTVIEHEGGVTETTQLHPLLEAKRKAHKSREKILEAMVGTRREKYKKSAALKQSEGTDASTHFAELKKIVGEARSTKTEVTSLDKIKEDAEKVNEDLDIFDADWEE